MIAFLLIIHIVTPILAHILASVNKRSYPQATTRGGFGRAIFLCRGGSLQKKKIVFPDCPPVNDASVVRMRRLAIKIILILSISEEHTS